MKATTKMMQDLMKATSDSFFEKYESICNEHDLTNLEGNHLLLASITYVTADILYAFTKKEKSLSNSDAKLVANSLADMLKSELMKCYDKECDSLDRKIIFQGMH